MSLAEIVIVIAIITITTIVSLSNITAIDRTKAKIELQSIMVELKEDVRSSCGNTNLNANAVKALVTDDILSSVINSINADSIGSSLILQSTNSGSDYQLLNWLAANIGEQYQSYARFVGANYQLIISISPRSIVNGLQDDLYYQYNLSCF